MPASEKFWLFRFVIGTFLSITLVVATFAFSSQLWVGGSDQQVPLRGAAQSQTILPTVTSSETVTPPRQQEKSSEARLETAREERSLEHPSEEPETSGPDTGGEMNWTLYVIVANFTPPRNMTGAFSAVGWKDGLLRGHLVIVPSTGLMEQHSGRKIIHLRMFGIGTELTIPGDRLSGSTVYRRGDKLHILRTLDLNLDFVELFVDFEVSARTPSGALFFLELTYRREDGSKDNASFLVFNSVIDAKKGNGSYVKNHAWSMAEV